VGPRFLHTAEVTGSIPVTPTSTNSIPNPPSSAQLPANCQQTTVSRQKNALSAVRLEDLDSRTDHPLAKPDRAGLPPATIENGAGRGRCGVVRGCPLRTGRDRCEWHGSGTPDEDDVRRARKSGHQLDRRVRPDPGDHRPVGKGRRRPAAAGRWDSKPPPRWPGDRGQEREGAATCETAGCRESQDERTASMSVLTLTAQAMQGDRERFPGRGLRQLPLQASERRQARPHGAATVPGRG
jgi:hypothetical protein